MPAQRKPHKHQTRLSFQTLASSSPTKESYTPAIRARLASVRFEGSATRRSLRHTGDNSLPTPEPSSQPHAALAAPSSPITESPLTPIKAESTDIADLSDDDDNDIVIPSSKRRKIDDTQPAHTPTRRSVRLDALTAPQSVPLLRARTRNAARQYASSPPLRPPSSIGSPETSGDEAIVMTTRPTARPKPVRKVSLEDPFVVSDDQSEEEVRSTQRRSRPQPHFPRPKNDFVVDDDEVEYLSSDGETDHPVQRHRPSITRRRQRSRREQDELEDDLEDLQDNQDITSDVEEVDGDDSTGRRTRGGPVTTARDRAREHMEILKRRRAGEKIPRVTDSDDEFGEFEELDGADLHEVTVGRVAYPLYDPASDPEGGAENTAELINPVEDDDFIVEDEDGDENSQSLGRPHAEMPLEFTPFATLKPRELFVYIVEWLVKNKLAPAFSRDDPIYILAWKKINDQFKAQAGSRLISSAWNADFKNAILARPLLEYNYLGHGIDDMALHCDACNRSNHPAKYEFKLSGHAYHESTLEPIDEENDDDEEPQEDDDKASYDQAGHLLPSGSTMFNLGRFCAANAEMGHKLTHWKYHLNQSLLAYLDEQDVLSADSIIAREKLNKKKREKEAEKIVIHMDETGMLQQMWKNLQSDLEDARFGMEDHVAKHGGRRNRKRIGKVRVDRGNGRIEEWSEGGKMQLVNPENSEDE